MSTLKERFEQFMATLKRAENIDALLAQWNVPGKYKADYLAFDRRAIIEQKSLEADLHEKVQAVVDEYCRAHKEIGTREMSFSTFVDVLARAPDGKPFMKRLREMVTQRIDDVLAHADKQTRDTRETFSLASAVGIVVILNDSVQLIAPDYVADKAFDMLRKKLPTGEIRYPNNQVVLLISEAHRIKSDDPAELIPMTTLYSDAGSVHPHATDCATALSKHWAEFNGAFFKEWPGPTYDVETRDPEKSFRTE